MSELRRKRQQERQPKEPSQSGLPRKIMIGVLIAAAFAAAYYLGIRKRTSRLDGFAQCIGASGTKMYGLYWCTHCKEQEELFGSSFQYIPYVECGIKGQAHGEQESCKAAGVKQFPTWEFPNKERHEGVYSLPVLAEKTGCSLP
jgi:hypothetical protein